MKVPNYERAYIPEAKIVKYLLNLAHITGGPKAVFFMAFGFSLDDWQHLAEALYQHLATYEVTQMVETPEGINYVIEGLLSTPDGRNPMIRAVWTIDADITNPRFVTAYPLKRG